MDKLMRVATALAGVRKAEKRKAQTSADKAYAEKHLQEIERQIADLTLIRR